LEKFMKKYIHVILLGMLAVSLTVACSKKPEEAAAEVTTEIHENIDAAKDAATAAEESAKATAEQAAAEVAEAKEEAVDAVKAAKDAAAAAQP
jgi:F0F1-type ATP synthase membrane subunit b/b'